MSEYTIKGRYMSEAAITVGSQISVGKVIVDPAKIQGVGGWHNPYLHIPIKIQIFPTKKDEQIALIRLTASLHLTETIDINNQFGDRISYDLLFNMPNRSLVGTAPSEGGAQLLFSLTHEQIKLLDDIRHRPNSNLFLHLEPVVVRLRQTEQAILTLGEQRTNIGNLSDFVYPWLAEIGKLRIETAEMKWTESIFPDIGYDRYRLVEVGLPTSDILVPKEAIEYFQGAKKYYDEGNNTECLRECRLALEEIETHLSTGGRKFVPALGSKRTEPEGKRGEATMCCTQGGPRSCTSLLLLTSREWWLAASCARSGNIALTTRLGSA